MKLIFYCFGGTHSSVAVSSVHLGILPSDRVPTAKEILGIGRFDQAEAEDAGVPYCMGKDDLGREIYVLGVQKSKDIGIYALSDICMLLGCPENELIFVPTLPTVGMLTRIGGYLSRSLGMVWPGRPLVVQGIRRDYRRIIRIASLVKDGSLGNP